MSTHSILIHTFARGLLLGNRVQAELKSKPAQELVALLGRYPNPPEAIVWKQSLKQMTRPKRQRYGEDDND